MTLSMHQASVPVFIRALTNLSNILKKGEAHAAAKGFEPAILLGARLAPDMFSLTRQVQIACDGCVRGAARLAGAEIPSNPDVETSFADLQARIERTIAYLQTFGPDRIDGSEERQITIPLRDRTLEFTGRDFLLGFALPNIYFHVTAAYAILRHNGVELGKGDFLGG